jgi:hypothetical protein
LCPCHRRPSPRAVTGCRTAENGKIIKAFVDLVLHRRDGWPEEDAVTANEVPAGSTEPSGIDTTKAHAARVYNYLLGGLDLVEPRVVQAAQWRPGPGPTVPESQMWCVVGRKAS